MSEKDIFVIVDGVDSYDAFLKREKRCCVSSLPHFTCSRANWSPV